VRLVAAADGCLVALAPGFERLTVPSRASTFLSAGRPLVTAMAPGADVARLVTSQGCGWNVGSAEELEALVARWSAAPGALVAAGARARAVYDERLSRARGVARYGEVIEDVLEA
jgi:hypothetical protein